MPSINGRIVRVTLKKSVQLYCAVSGMRVSILLYEPLVIENMDLGLSLSGFDPY